MAPEADRVRGLICDESEARRRLRGAHLGLHAGARYEKKHKIVNLNFSSPSEDFTSVRPPSSLSMRVLYILISAIQPLHRRLFCTDSIEFADVEKDHSQDFQL